MCVKNAGATMAQRPLNLSDAMLDSTPKIRSIIPPFRSFLLLSESGGVVATENDRIKEPKGREEDDDDDEEDGGDILTTLLL